jgi:fatty-acyl-CoA synthase
MPEIYYALAKAGLVGIPLNNRLAPVEIVALMSAMGAKAMLFETRFTPVAEKVRAELPQVKAFVVIGDAGPSWASKYEVLLAESLSAEPDVEVEESDAYYYNLTSGTTGLPKAYVLTQYNNAFVGPVFEAFDMTSHGHCQLAGSRMRKAVVAHDLMQVRWPVAMCSSLQRGRLDGSVVLLDDAGR